jgi:hypothetical protein
LFPHHFQDDALLSLIKRKQLTIDETHTALILSALKTSTPHTMTEANSITQPNAGILPVNTSIVATEEYLETDNGVFQLQSIAGDEIRLLPEGMHAPCEDKSALYRTELVKTVVKGLERTHKDHNRPGVYVQGPEDLDLIKGGRRNRFATVFWYLSDVETGGETVFPRFNRRREMSMKDCSGGLKVKPEKGKVIIFYSMTPNGKVDPYSLHGACPVEAGLKWAGNKWIWNEPQVFVSL